MQDKISAILNDPASMEKIMQMASMLSSQNADDAPAANANSPTTPPENYEQQAEPTHASHNYHAESGDTPHSHAPQQNKPHHALSLLQPMGDMGHLMRAITNMDPMILNSMSRIVHEYSRPDDHRVRLMHAVKPFLNEEYHGRISQAAKMLKLAHTAKIALEMFTDKD